MDGRDADRAVRDNEGLCHWAVRDVLGWTDRHPGYEDAVQVCRIVLWRSAVCHDPGRLSARTGRPVSFAAYAVAGMRIELRRLCRREQRAGFNRRRAWNKPAPDGAAVTIRPPAPLDVERCDRVGREADPAETVERECLAAQVQTAIDALPGRVGGMVRGCLVEGRAVEAVGREVGLSRARADVRLVVGREMLRERLRGAGT